MSLFQGSGKCRKKSVKCQVSLPAGRQEVSGKRKNMRKNRILNVVLLACIFIFMVNIVYSQEQANVNELITEALKNNPQIKAARMRYEAGMSRVKLLRSLADPKLEFEYDKIRAGMDALMRGKTAPMRTFGISQEIPFPTKLFLRKQAAEQEAKSLKEELKEKENEIVQKVKEAYWTLSLNARKLQITEDTKILLDQLIQTLTNRYSIGQVSQQEVLKAQTEYAKLDNEAIMLKQENGIFQAMLKALLSRLQESDDFRVPLQLETKNLALDRPKLLGLLKENRPELRAFQEMLRKSEIDYTLAKQEYLPDFMFKYQREERNSSAGGWAAMAGVTVPLWFWEKQSSFVKEAKAQLEEAKAEYKALENMLSSELEAALVKIESQKRLAKLYETSFLPQAEAAFRTASIGFEAGKNDFLNFLDSERMLLEFKLDYARVLVDLELAHSELERAVGVDLSS